MSGVRTMARPALAGTIIIAGTAAAGAVPAMRYLLDGHVGAARQIAGWSLILAAAFCYVKVMRQAMIWPWDRTRAVDLVTLALLMTAGPVAVGRPWMTLGFIWPAAALAGIPWPLSVPAGLAALAGPALTGGALGETGFALARDVGWDAVIAVVLAAGCAGIRRARKRPPG